MFLPLLFKDGLKCLIVGGGQVASRKVEALARIPCAITVVAPDVTSVVADIVRSGSAKWLERQYTAGDCKGFQLVVAATPHRAVNIRVSNEATGFGIPVNVVDDPDLSTAIFPAVWREGPLLLAVSSEGVAPFMAAAIRTTLATYAQGMGRWVEIAGRFREIVRVEVNNADEQSNLYKKFLDAGQPAEFDRPPESGRLSDWIAWLERRQK